MKHWFVNSYTTILLLCACRGLAAQSSPTLNEVENHIDAYQMEDAKRKLDSLSADVFQSAKGKYIRGKYLFFLGKYKKSEALLKEAIQKTKTELDWKYLRDQVEISRRQSNVLKQTKPKYGFTFFYQNGTDALLIPYALRTLLAQKRYLKKELGDTIEQMRVYILPSVQMLSEMCGLSEEQIEATGTVAVSKYNRIMILSPKLIVGGYPWLDTMAHELTHISITRLSSNRAPIWLHEGIAKLFEAKWRGVRHGKLVPVHAYLLDKAARERRLIPLRRFHPSVSYLPNQEDAALAYAQGLSFLTYLTQKFKPEHSLQSLLRLVAQIDVEPALRTTTSYDINKLYRWWQDELVGARNAPAELVPLMKRRFQTRSGSRNVNIDPVLSKEVRRHIRVGDLLRLRGHIDGAVKEYEWALSKSDSLTPDIVDRLADALLAQKNPAQALKLLGPMKALYPNHSTIFIQAGEAHTKLGNFDKAEKELRTAIALDPFHPDVHCMLSAILQDNGNTKDASLEKNHCLTLSSAVMVSPP